ncbi:hypothetical protein [Jannaschia pohangensis]|uniref:hypothetical protein n=1 Tax=Jannaschia pohangensis TaxID=390807 RepID=UPI001113BC7B|nr:hypothetical protein [Jannaschia pohangensis]
MRKLPRILSESGRPLFFRFWETDSLALSLQTEPEMFGPAVFDGGHVEAALCIANSGCWLCPKPDMPLPRRLVYLTNRLRQAYGHHASERFWCDRGTEFQREGLSQSDLDGFRMTVERHGLTDADAVESLSRLQIRMGRMCLAEDWALAELADGHRLPAAIRADRLINVARDRGCIDVEAMI